MFPYQMHKQLADRIELAQLMQETGLAGGLAVDSMEDLACTKYGALPERLCLLTPNGRVHFMTNMGPWGYSLSGLDTALSEVCGKC